MDHQAQEIVAECRRQQESCLYTSTAMYEWLKEVRVYRVAFIVVPIICGAIASARILVRDPTYDWPVAICALVAGLFPALFKALDLDVSLKTMSDSAHRFKVLQDRFWQAASITSAGPVQELQDEFKTLMDRIDDARSASPPIPARHFKKAQQKIAAGAYDFIVDASSK